jgi:hypothetical protein
MTRTEKLNSLFDFWQLQPWYETSVVTFRRDGILDEGSWDRSKQILFILKDANGSYTSDLRNDWKRKSWPILSHWTYGLENIKNGKAPSFDEAAQEYEEGRFHRAAILNLKKAVGGARVETAEVERYVVKDRGFILEEIAIIAPSVVVCCGTFDTVRLTLLDVKVASDGRTPHGCFKWPTQPQGEGCLWIDSWHPSYRRQSYRTKYEKVMRNAECGISLLDCA